jgi:hypothetical protein
MVAVWVVVGVLVVGVGAVAIATRHHGDDVEPSVREFTEFRDAISRQVAAAHDDTRSTRQHLDRRAERGPSSPAPDRTHEPQARS